MHARRGRIECCCHLADVFVSLLEEDVLICTSGGIENARHNMRTTHAFPRVSRVLGSVHTEAQWWLAAHQHLDREAPVLGALRLDGVEVEHELREADGSTAASVVHGAESRDARFVAWASEPPTHRRTPPHTAAHLRDGRGRSSVCGFQLGEHLHCQCT